MKKLAFVFVLAASLAACSDNSAVNGAGSSSSNSSDSSLAINKSKSISSSNESSKTVTVSAFTIIADSIKSRYGSGIGQGMRALDMKNKGEIDKNSVKMLAETVALIASTAPQTLKNLDLSDSVIEVAQAGGGPEKIEAAILRGTYERRVVACVDSMGGWEIDPIHDQKSILIYTKSISNHCDFANLIFTEIASKLDGKIMNDPDAARSLALASLAEISLESLSAAWSQVMSDNSRGNYIADLSGATKGVKFVGPNGVYTNEGHGFVVQKNSGPWFGEGRVSGRLVDLQLRSALSAKMEKSKSINSSEGTQSGAKTGAEIGIK